MVDGSFKLGKTKEHRKGNFGVDPAISQTHTAR